MKTGPKTNRTLEYMSASGITLEALAWLVLTSTNSPNPERMVNVIRMRADDISLDRIAASYGVTRQNVLILEKRALAAVSKLRDNMI